MTDMQCICEGVREEVAGYRHPAHVLKNKTREAEEYSQKYTANNWACQGHFLGQQKRAERSLNLVM